MENINTLWEKIKSLPDKEWRHLRERRDRLAHQTDRPYAWKSVIGTIPQEDLEQMKEAIESECEGIDPDDWR